MRITGAKDMKFLYKTDDMKLKFGEHWVGPDVLPHNEKTLVAIVNNFDPNLEVKIYCSALPSKFFYVEYHNDESKISLETGSGNECMDWALQTAKLINSGMVIIN